MPGIVYVVDDDASLRTTIQQLLEAAGYRVITYASAQQLLDQRPDENSPGCILLDVRMPGLSGPEVQGRLTEFGSTLPIVFLTGYMDIIVTVKALKAGADNFFIKPVRSDELLKALEKAIARHETALALKGELEALRTRLSTLTRASGWSSRSSCGVIQTSMSRANWAAPSARSRRTGKRSWKK